MSKRWICFDRDSRSKAPDLSVWSNLETVFDLAAVASDGRRLSRERSVAAPHGSRAWLATEPLAGLSLAVDRVA
ncbi:hypothetical protein [Sphingomonas koreensis]